MIFTNIALFGIIFRNLIFFLQETKLKPECEIKYIREWNVGPCIFNSVTGGKSGTAILLKGPGIRFCEGSKIMDIEGRVIAVDVEFFGSKFHLVNSFGPIESGEKIPFLNRLYLKFANYMGRGP